MFDLSFEKLLVVLVLALVVLGPERLPQVARAMAQTRTNLRRLTTVHPEAMEALRDPRRAVMNVLTDDQPESSGSQAQEESIP